MEIPVLVLTLVLAAVFVGTAVPKLTGQAQMRERMDHLGVSPGLTRVLGVLELAAVAGLLLGLLWPPLGIAAAIGLALQMTGAVVYHARAKDPAATILTPVIFAVAALALVYLHVRLG
ncbi:DoxX family protein [Micromonospora chalcea]|uniref:DoxX family protein n=1 Tax=Micromonospora TaxID=1873 RepID=UPI001C22AA51|nr:MULTISPECIES: DoxX family protein [unclassified Micromonospora]MBU8861760.1 DoxX family protein [Micromonospora sp. WMMB482]MDM4781338.1 DoxX family protein [Micromonospora sp. b486]MDW3848838.1 DoxX family protein [Micromonospora sp. BRA006-A]WFF05967.1 DoxX family protein [Micromonospora sp. WMMD1076]